MYVYCMFVYTPPMIVNMLTILTFPSLTPFTFLCVLSLRTPRSCNSTSWQQSHKCVCYLFNFLCYPFVSAGCHSNRLLCTITVCSTLSFMYIKLFSALHNVCCAVIFIFNRIQSQFFKIKMGKIKKNYSEFSCIVSRAKRKHPLMEGRNPGDGYIVLRERPQN
jgi:hypothetical protein